MKVAGILMLAALAGYAVYWMSLRAAGENAQPVSMLGRARAHHRRARAGGAEPAMQASVAAAHRFGSVYVPPAETVTWHRRLLGLAGLVVLVAFSSGVLAYVVYQMAHHLRLAVEKWAGA